MSVDMEQMGMPKETARADADGRTRTHGYLPIWLSTLQVNTVTDFDIYILIGEARTPVLFRRHRLPFSEDVRERLMDRGVERLYVEARQQRMYERYVESNLGRILADTDLETTVKSEAVYVSATGLVRDCVERPLDEDSVERAGVFVEDACRFMLDDRMAFRCMLGMMAFDYRIFTHSVNVMMYSVALAHRLGLGNEDVLSLFAKGVLFHDVGKSRISPTTLSCRGRLSPYQWEEMKRHTEYGETMLREVGLRNALVLDVVRHHHEKPTGSGYPDGLKEGDLSPFVRVVTIADVFDALTTRRPYKEAMASYPALRLMQEQMMSDLDPEFFGAFIRLMGFPEGE